MTIHKDTVETFWERMREIHGPDVGPPSGRDLHFYEIDPKDATAISLPEPGVRGPRNELDELCPWPWDPIQLKGAPLGQYHCPYCLGMCMAGMDHLDHTGMDAEIARFAMRERGIPPRNWREYGVARLP